MTASRRRTEHVYAAFGPVRKLTDEQLVAATAWERIATVQPFIVSKIKTWQRTLTPRERANCDEEDAWTAIVAKLAAKDQKWKPEVARYITFAEVIIRHELEHLREKSRTVESPKNCAMRLRLYESDAAGSRGKTETAERMRRTIGGVELDVDPDAAGTDEPPELTGDAEEIRRQAEIIGRAKQLLPDAMMVLVVEARMGTSDSGMESLSEVSRRLKMPLSDVTDLWTRAAAILRRVLEVELGGGGSEAV